MQQVRRINDASQSMQELRIIQQKRDHSTGLIKGTEWNEGTKRNAWSFLAYDNRFDAEKNPGVERPRDADVSD